MSDSYLAQWIAKIDTGHVITEEDMATLARMRLALHSADKHHRQAREAQAILAALRNPSEAVIKAVKDAIYEELGIEYWDGKTRRILYYAVAAAEKEVGDG